MRAGRPLGVQTPPASLPPLLQPLSWDHDFAQLRWETDKDLITGRILMRGDWDAAHWLVQRIGREGIRDWIRRRRGRGFDARTLRFWELMTGIPHGTVTRWLRREAGLAWTARRMGQR